MPALPVKAALWFRDGQLNRHAGALSGAAHGSDAAPVGFDQGFGDGQAQAKAARSPGPRVVSAIKALKNLGQISGGNADAVVLKRNLRVVFMASHCDLDRRSLGTVANCVLQ